MSSIKLVSIICDSCNRYWGPENVTIEQARRKAKKDKWLTRVMVPFRDSTVRIASDYCPKCIRYRRLK